MTKRIVDLLKDRRGATAIEYGLIAALIALVLVTGAATLGNQMNDSYTGFGDALADANN